MRFSSLRSLRTLPLFLLAACAASTPDGGAPESDGAEITAGQIVAGDNPYYWANVPFENHAVTFAALGAPLQDSFTPDDDPLRVRLQAIADRFDGALRAATHNTVAPKPIVKLLKSAQTYNAWSSGTYARLGVPLGQSSTPTTEHVQLIGIGSPGAQTAEDWSAYGASILHPAEWKRLGSFTQVWDLAKSPCKLTSQNTRVDAAHDCAFGSATSDDVVVLATSPYLTIATDLVSILADEKSMAFVMAHELGHMYRAHTSPLTERKYSFWYDDGPNVAKRPVPSARDAELQATFRRVTRVASPLDAVAGSTLPVRTRPALLALASAGAFASCATYTDWSATHDLAIVTALAQTGGVLGDDLQSAYLDYERAVLACPGDATFVDAGADALAPGQVAIAAVAGAFSSAQAPALPNAGETLQAFLTRLNDAGATLDADEAAFLQMVRDESIGLYTIEQEADEVALELMTRVGYKADDGIQGWLQFLQAFAQISVAADVTESGNATPDQCATWLQNGFMEPDPAGHSTRVKVSLGSLADTHHGDCYRLYNLWRESKAHTYRSVAPPIELQPAWSELVAHAAELTDEASAAGL